MRLGRPEEYSRPEQISVDRPPGERTKRIKYERRSCARRQSARDANTKCRIAYARGRAEAVADNESILGDERVYERNASEKRLQENAGNLSKLETCAGAVTNKGRDIHKLTVDLGAHGGSG